MYNILYMILLQNFITICGIKYFTVVIYKQIYDSRVYCTIIKLFIASKIPNVSFDHNFFNVNFRNKFLFLYQGYTKNQFTIIYFNL